MVTSFGIAHKAGGTDCTEENVKTLKISEILTSLKIIEILTFWIFFKFRTHDLKKLSPINYENAPTQFRQYCCTSILFSYRDNSSEQTI